MTAIAHPPIPVIAPAEVISRRVALQAVHTEASVLESQVQAAIASAADEFMELLVCAAEQGYPAPTFPVGENDTAYSLYAPRVLYGSGASRQSLFSRLRGVQQMLACEAPVEPGDTPRRTLLVLNADFFGVPAAHHRWMNSRWTEPLSISSSERVLPASELVQVAFARHAADVLDQLARRSHRRVADAHDGLASMARVAVALSA